MSADMSPFWEAKPLWAFNTDEWEAVCDGCAKCCLLKLEDEDDPNTVYFTDAACRLLDLSICRCTDYANRTDRVPGCARLAPDRPDLLGLMPPSCAYRRLAEGRGLPAWHYLVCGDHNAVHAGRRSIRDRVVAEPAIDPEALADRVVTWPFEDRDRR